MTFAPDLHDDFRDPDDDHQLDLDEARHVAAHAVAHLHFGQRFGSLGAHSAGWWEKIDPIWGPDPVTNSRVSLAGACMDVAVDLIEDGDSPGTGPWLESWRDDVAHHSHGYRHDMVAAGGGVAAAAAWSLAFCRLNFDLIDELAMMLVRAEAPIDYNALAARFHGRTVDVDPDALEAAEFDFAGQTLALECVDEAVADYLAADGTK